VKHVDFERFIPRRNPVSKTKSDLAAVMASLTPENPGDYDAITQVTHALDSTARHIATVGKLMAGCDQKAVIECWDDLADLNITLAEMILALEKIRLIHEEGEGAEGDVK
jgi:hypothetical protein